MEKFSLIIKGKTTSSHDMKGIIHTKIGIYPADIEISSFTKHETIYMVSFNGGMHAYENLTKWFCNEPRDPPFPEGTLLFYSEVKS